MSGLAPSSGALVILGVVLLVGALLFSHAVMALFCLFPLPILGYSSSSEAWS